MASKSESEKPKTKTEKKPLKSKSKSKPLSGSVRVVRDLKELYSKRLLPLERQCLFHKFHNPEILESELSAKPSVLLVGQYSTGKTSFIRQLIGMDYPEMHIGPEPTTDKFIAVVHGDQPRTIKGNALTGVNDLPFAGLSAFGSGFLNKFTAAVTPSQLLRKVNIIDTPGVLSGEKQRTSRGYDFAKVCRWFAERSDLILLMFDPSKLDISDELKSVIEELQPFEEKVHCVLNKADNLDTESLMRVYGALLWSMGKVFRGAEVTRVYVGSFQDTPPTHPEHARLFDKDKKELMSRIDELPKACAMRKVNEMVKRIRLATVNTCVLGHLRAQLPTFWGKEAAQDRLINNLPAVFEEVRRKYGLAEGDFPKVDEFKEVLRLSNFSTFPSASRDSLVALQNMLTIEIPNIISFLHGITRWNPDDEDDTAGDEDMSEEVDESFEDEVSNVGQKHISLVNLDPETRSRSEKASIGLILVGIFGALLAVIVYLSVQEKHKTVIDIHSMMLDWLTKTRAHTA